MICPYCGSDRLTMFGASTSTAPDEGIWWAVCDHCHSSIELPDRTIEMGGTL